MKATHQIIDCNTGQILISQVMVAQSSWQRFRGLMFRSPRQADVALWLSRCASIHTMWMRFTIDAHFIDRNGVVLDSKAVRPWRMTFGPKGTTQILETKHGSVAFKVGSQVRLESLD